MFSRSLEQSLNKIFTSAREKRHEFITLEHLLMALTENPEAQELLMACGADIPRLRSGLSIFIDETTPHIPLSIHREIQPTLSFQRVIHHAIQEAQRAGFSEVNGVNVLLAIFTEPESQAVYFLSQENVTRADALSYSLHGKIVYRDEREFEKRQKPLGGQRDFIDPLEMQNNTQGQGDEDSITDTYATNMNEKARKGEIDPLIGREHEIQRALQVLCRRTKNNPLFVGEAGVGKTALAGGVAQLIVDGKVPGPLADCTVYSLDLGVLLAGTKYRGDFEKRFKAILKTLNKKSGAIIFIDEIHNLIGAGSATGGTLDASNLIKPLLSAGDLRCMGATTYEEYRKFFSKDQALSRRFQKIDVEEPTETQAIEILEGLKLRYEAYHHVHYTQAAIERLVQLSSRYMGDRHLPDKAIDVMDEAGATQHLKPANQRRVQITEREIDKVFSKLARIPIESLSCSDKKQLSRLSSQLSKVIYGQDNAIESLTSAVKLSRSGLGDQEKPVGSFLLVGPTGVGKTEVMRELAKHLNIEFLRFDMSEYMERHSVSKLIGSPPGYVGYDDGGMLTEAVRKHPHAVLLLDEIEKAHPDIFNILLQVMDYGHLTDSNGRTVDFRHVIIAMTSNVGVDKLEKNSIGFSSDNNEDTIEAAVNATFSPEFRNRLDKVITFDYLPESVIIKVVDKFLEKLRQQLTEKKIIFSVTPAAKKWLASRGYDKKMGARPMTRVIQEKVRLPIVESMLRDDSEKRIEEIIVTVRGDELVFEYRKQQQLIEENG
jgi:ATP-dependent Clp protease ATP-binding subunit ClpA